MPEAARKLAGGASHRTPCIHGQAPAGAPERCIHRPSGAIRFSSGSGGLRHRLISHTPPAWKAARDSFPPFFQNCDARQYSFLGPNTVWLDEVKIWKGRIEPSEGKLDRGEHPHAISQDLSFKGAPVICRDITPDARRYGGGIAATGGRRRGSGRVRRGRRFPA